jgi:beta-glucosidase-like glycosyl hydrolase
MATAATGSGELAEKAATATVKEMRMTGIRPLIGPVVDVKTDSRNPVRVIGTYVVFEAVYLTARNIVGLRSFGDDVVK